MLTQLLSHTVLFESVLGVNSIVDAIIIIIKLTEVMMMMMMMMMILMMMKDSRLNHEFHSCRNQSCSLLGAANILQKLLSEVISLIEAI